MHTVFLVNVTGEDTHSPLPYDSAKLLNQGPLRKFSLIITNTGDQNRTTKFSGHYSFDPGWSGPLSIGFPKLFSR